MMISQSQNQKVVKPFASVETSKVIRKRTKPLPFTKPEDNRVGPLVYARFA